MGEIQMRRVNENELLPKDLKDICNPNLFGFETTKEIDDISDLIYGQDRGIKALEFGIGIHVYQALFRPKGSQRKSTFRLVLYL